jgi:hypothetical protein
MSKLLAKNGFSEMKLLIDKSKIEDINNYEYSIQYHSLYEELKKNSSELGNFDSPKLTKQVEDIIKDKFYQELKKIVSLVDGKIRLFRAIKLKDINTIDVENLGVFWAYNYNFAEVFDDEDYQHNNKDIGRYSDYVIKADFNLIDVDWSRTLDLYIMSEFGEGEIRLKKDAPAYNLQIQKRGDKEWLNIDKIICVERIFKAENGGKVNAFDDNNPDSISNKKEKKIKELLIKTFDYLPNNLEFIGKGLNGYSFIVEIENELYVAKYTKSITEFWLTQMAFVSNPPNIVTIKDVRKISDDFEYGIIHKWVDRDGMPNESVWNVAVGLKTKEFLDKEKLVPIKEREYIKELAKKYQNQIENYFGISIDVIQSNWGYEDGKLVLFDIDGDVKKSQYEEWMNIYINNNIRFELGGIYQGNDVTIEKKETFNKGGEVSSTNIISQIWSWFGIKF